MTTAVVICPGRGTYNKTELGYLARYHADKSAMITGFDKRRRALGQETLTDLDGAAGYSISRHTRGDNASGLIYGATLGDFLSIDRAKIEVVAVTGNSMGWYSALACAGAVTFDAGFEVVNTMGTLMQEHLIGGQIIYPVAAEDWAPNAALRARVLEVMGEIDARAGHDLSISIDLGGMLVLAGNTQGLAAFEGAMPVVQGKFPMRLANHAGFHSNMQGPVATEGRAQLGVDLFGQPALPMIDGRGAIWWPGAVDTAALRDYTLGHQVVETYDFARAIRTAAREFAPDLFIITGPGTTLGGAVAQSLIGGNWRGMASKADFQARQAASPLLASMGMDDQRAGVI